MSFGEFLNGVPQSALFLYREWPSSLALLVIRAEVHSYQLKATHELSSKRQPTPTRLENTLRFSPVLPKSIVEFQNLNLQLTTHATELPMQLPGPLGAAAICGSCSL